MRLIGVGGTNGAGKDLLSDILANDYGWLFVSASGDLIIPELKKRGLALERENMAALTAEWNRTLSPGAVVDKAIEMYEQKNVSDKYKGLVISSIRHPWEAKRIHELGGKVIWVDADPKIRYQRIYSRGQGSKDKKSYEQFLVEEKAEMTHHSDDQTTLNMAGVKAMADNFIENNTNDLDDFKKQIKQTLAQ